MKPRLSLALCAFVTIGLSLPFAADAAAGKTKDYCHAYAKKKADRKMGPKYVENAAVFGATGGLAGKAVGGKKTFTGFGFGGAALGILVANDKWRKIYKQYYTRCMPHT